MRCPNCKTDNRSGVKFCEECGQPLPQPAVVNVQKNNQQKSHAAVPCSACGHVNRLGLKFCEECGKELFGIIVPLAGLTCADCGHRNSAGMRFCEECGQSLQVSRPQHTTRRLLIIGGVILLIGIVTMATLTLLPKISQSDAVAISLTRIQTLYPNAGNAQPVVQTYRSDGDVTYRIEYQTDTGRIIFIVDAETGETIMLGER